MGEVVPGNGPAESSVRSLCHDLRQPLAIIRLLADDPGPGHDPRPDAEARLAGIRHEAAWLIDLVDSVLGDRLPDDRVVLDLGQVVRFAMSCTFAGTGCSHMLDVTGEVLVVARRTALARALICLLDNAIRAAGELGHVEVTVTSGSSGGVVTIADDGPGLGNLAPQHSLGLVTARAILTDCGGRLALGNRDGGGAVATVRLPLDRRGGP
ncbi:histidine kinase [Intrasporangium oryzae NRRL B-24470]|uniref:histidine kinase n=1 Tax=Intrasporangium oryzae NRRL B-24470 TaxID=1386089 RepID=W9GCY7_9MICO|nr:HAMP domain-containing sensor histidine kinase [Intrasporangium oryzae]EWT01729.1 histidine kinase [Intrasporangium oryzae NRRL B-24470]